MSTWPRDSVTLCQHDYATAWRCFNKMTSRLDAVSTWRHQSVELCQQEDMASWHCVKMTTWRFVNKTTWERDARSTWAGKTAWERDAMSTRRGKTTWQRDAMSTWRYRSMTLNTVSKQIKGSKERYLLGQDKTWHFRRNPLCQATKRQTTAEWSKTMKNDERR